MFVTGTAVKAAHVCTTSSRFARRNQKRRDPLIVRIIAAAEPDETNETGEVKIPFKRFSYLLLALAWLPPFTREPWSMVWISNINNGFFRLISVQ